MEVSVLHRLKCDTSGLGSAVGSRGRAAAQYVEIEMSAIMLATMLFGHIVLPLSSKVKGSDNQEKLVYQIIEEAGNKGRLMIYILFLFLFIKPEIQAIRFCVVGILMKYV